MVEAQEPGKLRIALIGATGAVGKEIVRAAKQNEQIGELLLLVRNPLEEWKQEEFACKLTVLQMADFDNLE